MMKHIVTIGLLLVQAMHGLNNSPPPPHRPPQHLWHDYTLNDTIPAMGWYFDSRATSSSGSAATTAARTNTDSELSTLFAAALGRIPQFRVYPETDKWMFDAFQQYPIRNKRVLIVGSQVPWYEMLALAYGAKQVVVVEYQKILYKGKWEHQLQYVLPDELYNNNTLQLRSHIKPFDAIISISSEEHNGLGRYGDPLNPYGDIEHVNALASFGQIMFLSVPYNPKFDCLVFNAHRIYGPIRFPMLIQQWRQIDFIGDEHREVPRCTENITHSHLYQPVHVLQSKQLVNTGVNTALPASCLHNTHLDSFLQQYTHQHHRYQATSQEWIVYSCNCIQPHGCSDFFTKDHFDTGVKFGQRRPGCNCGGLGDRLNGILSSFVIAMITNRSFAIDWLSPCPLSEHLIPAHINWNTKRWQKDAGATIEGCLSLFDFPPSFDTFNGQNITEIIKGHPVVRVSSNVNLLSSLWSNEMHASTMKRIFGTDTGHVRPLFTKHFACLFHYLFELSPMLKEKVNQIISLPGRGGGGSSTGSTGSTGSTTTIGVQVRLGGAWDFNLMTVQNNLSTWTTAVEHQMSKSGIFQKYNIFVTSDQSSLVMNHISNYFNERQFPRVRVIGVKPNVQEDDVHLDHVDQALPVGVANNDDDGAGGGSDGNVLIVPAPGTSKCSASISKMFLDWWVLGEMDVLFISMSGFGASANWRSRHNETWIVHAWEDYFSKRYWYDLDYQEREPNGDDGKRVIEQE